MAALVRVPVADAGAFQVAGEPAADAGGMPGFQLTKIISSQIAIGRQVLGDLLRVLLAAQHAPREPRRSRQPAGDAGIGATDEAMD
ncbi:hypothetical protein D9M68_727810 [compost metagenome]